MKYLILLTIIFIPPVASADYFAQDYDPDYLPYNFTDAVEADDFNECDKVLEQFDDAYWQLDEKFEALNKGIDYNGPVWMPIGEESAFNLNQVRDYTEEAIRLCHIDYREYQREQEQIAREKEAKRFEEEKRREREEAIQTAIDKCDFDFFEEMTNSEKMSTFDDREACKNKVEEESQATAQQTNNIQNESNIISRNTNVPELVNSNVPDTKNEVEESLDTSTENEDLSTTTDDLVTLSQEELDQMIEEKAAEKVEEQEKVGTEETKPSIIKRVFDFLFGWF